MNPNSKYPKNASLHRLLTVIAILGFGTIQVVAAGGDPASEPQSEANVDSRNATPSNGVSISSADASALRDLYDQSRQLEQSLRAARLDRISSQENGQSSAPQTTDSRIFEDRLQLDELRARAAREHNRIRSELITRSGAQPPMRVSERIRAVLESNPEHQFTPVELEAMERDYRRERALYLQTVRQIDDSLQAEIHPMNDSE